MIVHVDVAQGGYDVVIDDGARHQLAELVERRASKARRVVIVSSASLVSKPWFDVDSGRDQYVVTVGEGERAKSLGEVKELLEKIAGLHLSREDVIVGVGGGAITDLTGFAASIYLRGIALVQIPTSLVGQVDAAIGGKTGVNLDAGKNLAGTFYQPLGVLCDVSVLTTLDERERLSGLGEVAKCWLLEGRGAEDLHHVSLLTLVERSVRLKAALVSEDEREAGSRVLLNYGHTLAHAMEKIALARNFDELRHGEAVAVGLAYAIRLARELGRVSDRDVSMSDEVLAVLGLDRALSMNYDVDELIAAMRHDKKAHHDLSFVLASSNGFSLVANVDERIVRTVLQRFQGEQ
ncbi:MAG: 3-dehydroquinate synthase [Acidimicrobiales bacterium]